MPITALAARLDIPQTALELLLARRGRRDGNRIVLPITLRSAGPWRDAARRALLAGDADAMQQ